MQKQYNIKNFYLLISLLSVTILIGAIYIEYVIGAQPCVLCKYQRIPYVVSIFLCFAGYKNPYAKIWIYSLILIFLISIVISAYHVGIENNIFPEFSGCTVDNINIIDKNLLLKKLSEVPPNCKDVNFRIFGLSLATINVLISLIVVIISIRIIVYEKNRQKIS